MRFTEYMAIREYFKEHMGEQVFNPLIELKIVEEPLDGRIQCWDRYDIANRPESIYAKVMREITVNAHTQEIISETKVYCRDELVGEEYNLYRGRTVPLYPMSDTLRHDIPEEVLSIKSDYPSYPFGASYAKISDSLIVRRSDADLLY